MDTPSTKTTLLARLRNGADQLAWREFEAGYGTSEDAIIKVRQRVRARMEELIAQQVAEEDEIDVGSANGK